MILQISLDSNDPQSPDHCLRNVARNIKQFKLPQAKTLKDVRVDFYDINGKVYFGELTFYHWSGFMPFVPGEWDYRFGEWIKLPK